MLENVSFSFPIQRKPESYFGLSAHFSTNSICKYIPKTVRLITSVRPFVRLLILSFVLPPVVFAVVYLQVVPPILLQFLFRSSFAFLFLYRCLFWLLSLLLCSGPGGGRKPMHLNKRYFFQGFQFRLQGPQVSAQGPQVGSQGPKARFQGIQIWG